MRRFFQKNNHVLRSMIVLFLSTSIVLSGCGGEEPKPEEPEQTAQATSSDDDYHENAKSVEDGTMNADSVVISVGETTVPYSEYRSYYYFMDHQYEELLGEEVWKQSIGDKTIGQIAIEDVLRMIIQVKVIVKEAERQGVILEADEKEDADYNANKLCESLDEKTKQEAMITSQEMMKIFEENRLAEKMYHVITGQVGSDASVSSAKAIEILQLFKKADDSNRDKVNKEMQSLQKKIASSDKSFYYHAKQESELPEVQVIVGTLDEGQNIWKTAESLEIGVVSPVIQEADGFYLIYVLKKNDEEMNNEYRNRVISENQTKSFQETYNEWSGHYTVEVSDALLSE